MPEVQWYYARNDQQFGPVSAAELKQLADGGKLSPDDLLWREGMDSWNTAINLRGLFSDDTTQGKGLAAFYLRRAREEGVRDDVRQLTEWIVGAGVAIRIRLRA